MKAEHNFQSKTWVHSFKKNITFAGIIPNLKKSYKRKQRKQMKENKKQIGEMQPLVFGLQQMVVKTPFWRNEIHSPHHHFSLPNCCCIME